VFQPELNQPWEPECKDIIKQGQMQMHLFGGDCKTYWYVQTLDSLDTHTHSLSLCLTRSPSLTLSHSFSLSL
jgi:hypothetical protein